MKAPVPTNSTKKVKTMVVNGKRATKWPRPLKIFSSLLCTTCSTKVQGSKPGRWRSFSSSSCGEEEEEANPIVMNVPAFGFARWVRGWVPFKNIILKKPSFLGVPILICVLSEFTLNPYCKNTKDRFSSGKMLCLPLRLFVFSWRSICFLRQSLQYYAVLSLFGCLTVLLFDAPEYCRLHRVHFLFGPLDVSSVLIILKHCIQLIYVKFYGSRSRDLNFQLIKKTVRIK